MLLARELRQEIDHLLLWELILLMEHSVQRPEAQLLDVPQFPMPVEVVLGILAFSAYPAGHLP